MNVKDFIELVDQTPLDPGMLPIPAPNWTDSLLAEQLCACFRGPQHDLYQSYQSLKFELTFRIRCEGLDPIYLHTLLRMHWVGATAPHEGDESAADWPRAIALARIALASKPPTDEPWMHLHDRQSVVCGHAAFIQSLGFKLTVLGMHIVPVEPDALAQYIQDIAAEIGGKALMRALRGEMLVNRLSGRYVFIRRPSIGIGTPEADLPWNYLYHIAAKLWSTEPRTPNMARWDELKRVATAYAALINVQPYHVFEGINIAVPEMLRHMHSVAVYDAIFTIDQMQPRSALALLEGVLHHVDGQRKSPAGIPLKSVLRVARYILETASQSQEACTFSASRIAEDLKIRRENVINVLNAVFAYAPNSINANFGEITEFRRANFWNRPLIAETPEIYVLVDPRLCAPAMLHAVFFSSTNIVWPVKTVQGRKPRRRL